MVLEEYEHAKTRRENLRRSGGLWDEQRCLSHDVTAGKTARALRWRWKNALLDAGVTPSQIGYIMRMAPYAGG